MPHPKPKIVVTKNLKLLEDQIKRLESLGNVTFYNKDRSPQMNGWIDAKMPI